MKEITKEQAKENNLKFIQRIQGTNLSQTILIMQRYQEFREVKYYIMEFTALNEETHNGQILVSFWGDR